VTRVLSCVLVLALCVGAGQHARIDSVFETYTSQTPGCALGVFRDGAIAYARGYGMADLEHGVAITPSSLFDVGSVSKQFAAAAIVMLVDEGKLSFTDDIHKFIPALPNYGAPITLNELMWHTSGLRDYTSLLDLAGYPLEQATTDEQALAMITRQRGLDFPSGTQYEYSNTNYFLLSVIVKRMTAKTLAQFVSHNIFAPLGMTHAMYRTDYAMLEPNRAMGYAPAPSGRFKNSMSNWQQTGDGAVQLSIDDAQKWDENFYHPRVGGQRMVDALQTPGHLSNGTPLQYGRGEFLGSYRGLRSVTHSGAWIGYRAAFDRFPSVHTSVVVLCNSDAAPAGALAQRVEDIILAPYLKPTPVPVHQSAMLTATAAQAYAGSYFDQTEAQAYTIAAQGTKVVLKAGDSAYPLVPTGGLSFRLGSTPVSFSRDKSGAIDALRLGNGEGAVDARRFTPVTPTAADLHGVPGSYYSPDLDVTWHLDVTGTTLSLAPARYMQAGAAGKLQPQMRDTFTSNSGFAIHLTRDSSGAVTGFSLGAGRGLRALPFTRKVLTNDGN
jgi:CubicO group peptidase (beta-lactamase class C family)